jgi:putative ABC transport system substrate-binding protein
MSDLHGEFLRGMADFGYVEGRDFTMEWRFAAGHYASLPELAGSLVQAKPDVIVAGFTGAALALQRATKEIPIVLAYTVDPVGAGLISSLAKPGGNITGLATYLPEIASKNIEILKEIIPGLSRVGLLLNPDNPGASPMWEKARFAAQEANIDIVRFDVASLSELDARFADMAKQDIKGVVIVPDPLYNPPQQKIAALAVNRHIATIHPYSDYTKIGGLVSYGDSVNQFYRRAPYFIDRIWKGIKPSDIPVELPSKFVLTVNLNTAKLLSLTIPLSLLVRADEIID